MCRLFRFSENPLGDQGAKATQQECFVGILSSYPTSSGMDFFFILEKTLG
jgi:hypothetical protein